jgi:hypothetical protein
MPMKDCPLSFGGGWGLPVDSLGRVLRRPPGWINPIHLTLRAQRENRDVVGVVVVAQQAEARRRGGVFPCGARRVADQWLVACGRPRPLPVS